MRFVILFHETPTGSARPSHWDLMWETSADSPLTTFAVYGKPEPGSTHQAESLQPHRRDYLTYEGEVTNNRGSVIQTDAGSIEIVAQTADRIVLALDGERLRCRVALQRDGDHWLATFS